MTRLDMQTRILEKLNESTTAPQFWSTAQIDDLIQEGQEVLAEESRIIKRTVTVTVRPGTTYYQLRGIASDCMTPYRLTLPDDRIRLRVASPIQLDAYHLLWETVTGTPRWWVPIDWQTFALFPHPIQGGHVLKIDYFAWPHTLQDDGDTPEFGVSDADALVIYGVYMGLLKRWDVGRATVLFEKFMRRVNKSRSSTGMDSEDGRTWQQAAEPGVPFLQGLDVSYR